MVRNFLRDPRLSLFFATALLCGCGHQPKIAVTTYHYDNLRTGWDRHEDRLTPAKVSSSHFGVLYTPTSVDDQVDAQPLVVPDENITGGSSPGEYDVVYVATENNSVFAIDANSGKVLVSRQINHPVPLNQWPPPSPTPPAYTCGNNGPNVGINSTPVIDHASNTMYVVAYSWESGNTVYRLHALNLSDLTDRFPAKVISASHTLTNGTSFNFDPGWQRQRPALLLNNGTLYVAFGSFCDWGGPSPYDHSRGWVLGWKTPGLTPLAANQLNNRLIVGASPAPMFLSSVWMSGYGPAADPGGNLYFVTGNSDSNLAGNYYTTYKGSASAPAYANIQNSVVRLQPDLSAVHDVFTPWAQQFLDETDADYGSGGALVLPDQSGPVPHLVTAAGKDGKLYVLNADSLGGFNPPQNGAGATDNVVAEVNVGACWCGPSYFEGEDGHYIVTSGGTNINVWKLRTDPSVSLIHEGTSANVAGGGGGGQDSGFFTAISSDHHKHAIIWAVSRPDGSGQLWLYAFRALPPHGSNSLPQLFAKAVGTWAGGNANVVPVVANGEVFVATNQQLTILGLN
ncbi:MAG TPA: hypothetical protein VJO35_07585 [Terriglobales bacterium]|nr:hypothetical protein [Terriglobales bacterium]